MYWFFRETWSKGRSIRNQIKNKKAIDISKNNAKDGGCSGFDPPPARRSYNMLCHERHRRGTWVELSLAPDRMNFHCWASISSAERGSADQSERLNPLPFLYGWKLPCQCNQPQKNTTNKAPSLRGSPLSLEIRWEGRNPFFTYYFVCLSTRMNQSIHIIFYRNLTHAEA